MIKFWKPLRVTVALSVLLLITFIFVDFHHILPAFWYKYLTYLQFIPSTFKFIKVVGLISTGFIVVLLLTLFFGRIYCSIICPLGILQDVVSFVSRKTIRKNIKSKYSKPNNVIRYSLLGLSILPLAFGSIVGLYWLDPYSNYGRIVSDLGKPVYNLISNALASMLVKFGIYSIAPVDISFLPWTILIFPVIILFVIVGLSFFRGRLYCNSICPVGTLLGLISKVSIFRIFIDKHTCTKCAKCSFVCKSECIGIKEQTVDMSRCVGCMNCLKACDKSGIHYQFAYSGKKKAEIIVPGKTDNSKREFLTKGLFIAGALLTMPAVINAKHVSINPNTLTPIKRKNVSTPPGSISRLHFNNACTACHLCVTACPSQVLQPSFMEYGLSGIFKPYMDYNTNYCQIDCTKCGNVCPTGAILPLTHEIKKTTQIGTVKFIKTNCIVYREETSCGSCSEHCPTQAVSMVKYKGMLTIPEINDDICIGCGACEYACPAKPYKAIYVEGNNIHQIAKKPESQKVKDTSKDDFPF